MRLGIDLGQSIPVKRPRMKTEQPQKAEEVTMWLRRIDDSDDVAFIQRICRRAADIIEQQAREIERVKGRCSRVPQVRQKRSNQG
jgi:hypothetical protein